jgi:hypothetical protein
MKTEWLLKMQGLTFVVLMSIFFPAWARAADLGSLRLSQLEGDVQVQSRGMKEWLPAAINLPLRPGDRLWVPGSAWAQVETHEGSVVRIAAESSLEVLEMGKDSLQLFLSQGQAYVNFQKGRNTVLQLDTPVTSFRVYDRSIFNVAVGRNDSTDISVFRGAVFSENRNGEVRVGAGKMLSMIDSAPVLMALGPPNDWEKWNHDLDDSLFDDDEEGSEQYLPQELSGYGRDLRRNGQWVETSEYGYVWTPTTHISVDWVPYRHGRWVWIGDDYVWIGREPWGWAPYHYGRWAHIASRGWCWVPPRRNEVYWGPGYVSWVQTSTSVAWVPLAPREVYYGHGNFGPHSVNIINVHNYNTVPGRHYRNVHVRDAVTVLHRDTFLTGRHRNLEHRENPFLREAVHIGRPALKPDHFTRMPVIKDIASENVPPPHIRTLPGMGGDGVRPMVRERAAVPQVEGQGGLTPAQRQEILEHSVQPRMLRGRPDVNSNSNLESSGSAAPVVPVVPPIPVVDDKEKYPVFRGRPHMPSREDVQHALQGRPGMNPDAAQPATPPVHVQEAVPPAVPVPSAPVQVQEAPPQAEQAPVFRGRPHMPSREDVQRSMRGRPGMNPDAAQPATPPVHVQQAVPPAVPSAPAQVQQAPQQAEQAPVFRGRPHMPSREDVQRSMQGRPGMNPDVMPVAPPAQVQQNAPPPPPQRQSAQPDPEELKRLQQQAAEQAAAAQAAGQQDKGDKMRGMYQLPPGPRRSF